MMFSDPSTPAVPASPFRFTIGKASTVHDNSCGIWYQHKGKAHPVGPTSTVTCWRCIEIRKARIKRYYPQGLPA